MAAINWQPTASINTLKRRAEIIRRLRDWFYSHGVMEVETPQLSNGATTEPNIESFALVGRHLRTSAEFHLKRLLAAGCPDVYELGKVFRVDESGRHHNPEFTMLEWYRLGIDHRELITEVESLLRYLHVDETLEVACTSYRDFWLRHAEMDPATATCKDIVSFLERSNVQVPESVASNFDALQDLAMGTVLSDVMPKGRYSCIYDYPSSQASLARLDHSNPEWPVASRFEIYYGSVELANGFHELERFIAALNSGMPECAGVAIGIDRLIMVLLEDVDSLAQVMSFDWAGA